MMHRFPDGISGEGWVTHVVAQPRSVEHRLRARPRRRARRARHPQRSRARGVVKSSRSKGLHVVVPSTVASASTMCARSRATSRPCSRRSTRTFSRRRRRRQNGTAGCTSTPCAMPTQPPPSHRTQSALDGRAGGGAASMGRGRRAPPDAGSLHHPQAPGRRSVEGIPQRGEVVAWAVKAPRGPAVIRPGSAVRPRSRCRSRPDGTSSCPPAIARAGSAPPG